MSRYYRIDIADTSGNYQTAYTSFVNGQTDPGALDVLIDVPVYNADAPTGQPYVRIWGIDIKDIGQARNLFNRGIKVYGGMQKGLPLANPAQSGLLASGSIIQSFGNWVGVEQTLDILIRAGGPTPQPNGLQKSPNLVTNWKAGTSIVDAIRTTLSTAYPASAGFTINVRVNHSLVLSHDVAAFHGDLYEFGNYVRDISRDIVGGTTYPGIQIVRKDQTFTVYDNPGNSHDIKFFDMIGQPTWVAPFTIQVMCVMRADISVGDQITLPKAAVKTTAASWQTYNNRSIQQGSFLVSGVRHVGRYRQPQGEAWVTAIDATQTNG